MTAHLLLVTLGPVQDFITQSRRTRDLWHSSHMLSELSRAAACSLADHGAVLIIPAIERGDEELEPCWGFEREVDDPTEGVEQNPFAIANKILAEVPTTLNPEKLAVACRRAVFTLFHKHAAWVLRHKVGSLLDANVEDAWKEQVDSLIEFTAGWLPLRDGEFNTVRAQLDAAVSARKQLREFEPIRSRPRNVPKSSLCGSRDTLIPVHVNDRDDRLAREHGVSATEQLDAIGLIKRTGGLPDHFTPIINIALSPWIRRIAPTLEPIRGLCNAEGVQRLSQKLPCLEGFPYEASVLVPSRWHSLAKEKREPSNDLKNAVHAVHAKHPMPDPYVVCLVADGDKMGDAIQGMKTAAELRKFSCDLSKFARGARQIVEQCHRGSLVFAGGDDVLAFLPIDTALACADALRKEFARQLGHTKMTLSVGLGIGHTMEAMGQLLELGRDAEKLAKRERNSLAIIVDKRSGGRRSWTSTWTDDLVANLRRDAMQQRAGLSTRKIHEIGDVLARLPTHDRDRANELANVLEREVERLLARVKLDSGVDRVNGPPFGNEGYLARRRLVGDWINRLLIARELTTYDSTSEDSTCPPPATP